jgi:hypothetical protein
MLAGWRAGCPGIADGGCAQGCYNDLVQSKPTQAEHERMVDTWLAWAATCHRGTREGKQCCLALFQALQKLQGVPDSTPWVKALKHEMLGVQ